MKKNFTLLSKSVLFSALFLLYNVPHESFGQCSSSGITVTTGGCTAPIQPTDTTVCGASFSIPGLAVRRTLQNAQPNVDYLAYFDNSPGSFITVFDSSNVAIAWGTAPVIFSVPGAMDVFIQNNTDGVTCGPPPSNYDLFVTQADLCDDPVNITSSNITSFTADLNWNTQEPGNSWEYLVLPQGTPPSGSGTAVTDSSASISGLLGETDYDVYVRQECVSGDTSGWAGPHSFSTLACPSTNVTANLGGDTIVCEGDNFQITLDAGNPGSTYLWSTNQTSQNITVTQTGVYWAKVFDAQGCSSIDTVEITESAPPKPNLGSDQYVCLNEEINIHLDAGQYSSYVWNNGGQNQTRVADEYGEYWVIVTDSNGCSGGDTIVVDSLEIPSVHIDDETICPGDSVLLLAPFGFTTYNWSTGSQNQSTMASEEGQYTLIVTNDSGCADTTMPYVTVIDLGLDLGADTSVLEGDTLILNAPTGMVSYLWSTGGTLSSIALSKNNTPANIWVMIEDSNGCKATDTIFVDLIPSVGIQEKSLTDSRIYPNPISEYAQVELNLASAGDVHIQVLSLTGKVVHNERLASPTGKSVHTLNLNQLSSGVYLVRITAGDKTLNRKITKM